MMGGSLSLLPIYQILFIMTGLGDIIILIVVFRLIFGLLGAWWEGENKNDFRRDRKDYNISMAILAHASASARA